MTIPTQPNETGTATPTQGQGQPPAASATPPAYVTREEIEALRKELKESLSKNYQGVQSKTDSFQSKVQARLQEVQRSLDAWAKTPGVQISPEAAASIKQNAFMDALQESLAQPSAPGQGQQPASAEESELTPLQQQVTDTAFEIMETIGVQIEDDDPEVAIVQKASQGTPKEFYAAVREACKAKAARLSQSPQPTTPPPANPQQTAARMPGLSAGGTGAANSIQNLHGNDLWDAAMKKRNR